MKRRSSNTKRVRYAEDSFDSISEMTSSLSSGFDSDLDRDFAEALKK